MKQSKLRRRRVFRYAVLYFVMLVVFVGLVVGPTVAGGKIPSGSLDGIKKNGLIGDLFQPVGLNNDNTRDRTETGTGRNGYSGALNTMTTRTSSASSTRTGS
jgi:1,3-beta-glucan synthase